MSRRLFSYREGDRSEYLALYFLSALGLVAPVPRQEDIGFDMVCSVGEKQQDILTFNNQYLVSVKSAGCPALVLRPPPKWKDDDDRQHIAWFYNLDLPLILGVVDKHDCTISLYSTTAAYFQFEQWRMECGLLRLIPRVRSDRTDKVDVPKRGKPLEGYPGLFEYAADLGHPLEIISQADTRSPERMKVIRKRLLLALTLARNNMRYHRLGVPFFCYFSHTSADCTTYIPSFSHNELEENPKALKFVMRDIAPILASMAMLFKRKGLLEIVWVKRD